MNKKLLIVIPMLSVLLCNPVSAAVSSTNDTNYVLSDKVEPFIGYMTDNENEVLSSWYVFEKLDVSYTWKNGEWHRVIGIYSDGRDASSFDFDPYIMKNLPKVGNEGECITSDHPFYMYIGEGIDKNKLLNKIIELENKINSNHES